MRDPVVRLYPKAFGGIKLKYYFPMIFRTLIISSRICTRARTLEGIFCIHQRRRQSLEFYSHQSLIQFWMTMRRRSGVFSVNIHTHHSQEVREQVFVEHGARSRSIGCIVHKAYERPGGSTPPEVIGEVGRSPPPRYISPLYKSVVRLCQRLSFHTAHDLFVTV
jgi:hypothetical protein